MIRLVAAGMFILALMTWLVVVGIAHQRHVDDLEQRWQRHCNGVSAGIMVAAMTVEHGGERAQQQIAQTFGGYVDRWLNDAEECLDGAIPHQECHDNDCFAAYLRRLSNMIRKQP